jgi:hypothetical protein
VITPLLALLPILAASEFRVVHLGETVESIATELGEPGLAQDIRQLNQLGPDEHPPIGALLELPAVPGATLREQTGAVLHTSGVVTALLPQRGELAAVPGLELPPGSTVCTGPASFGTLRLARNGDSLDHDDVNLLAETCLTLISTVGREATRSSVLRIERGSIAVRGAESGGGTVIVESEAGITAGQGGGFRVSREADATRTEALEAPVAVLGAGQEVAVAAGQGSRTVQGQPPSAPVDLLLAGEPLRPQIGQPLRRPEFGWSTVDGALGYRLEIASSSDFSALVLVESTAEPSWAPELMFLPTRVEGLWWRVAAFDRVGFLGFPTEPRALTLPGATAP